MDFDSQLDRLIEDVIKAAATRKKPFKPVTVLIDGPSGAGKTWACAALADRAGWRVVHLDEFYPGWRGLEQGSRMVAEQVLRETNPGYWRWDWEANAPGEWASLDARDDLIVEGVGAVTPENIAAAKERGSVITVRLDGPRESAMSEPSSVIRTTQSGSRPGRRRRRFTSPSTPPTPILRGNGSSFRPAVDAVLVHVVRPLAHQLKSLLRNAFFQFGKPCLDARPWPQCGSGLQR